MKESHWTDLIVAGLAGFFGGATAILITGFSVEQTAAQSWLPVAISGVTAAAALLTVVLTRQTIDHARKSSEIQHRAYVQPIEALLGVTLNGWVCIVKTKNSGSTPALNARIRARAILAKNAPDLEDFGDAAWHKLGEVGPNLERASRYKVFVPAEMPRESVYYFWGEIEYRDAFDQARKSRFSYEIGSEAIFPMSTDGTTLPVVQMHLSADGNEYG